MEGRSKGFNYSKEFSKGVDQSELSTLSTPKGENLLVGRRGYRSGNKLGKG